jgi:Flp pilus assembly protein TadB
MGWRAGAGLARGHSIPVMANHTETRDRPSRAQAPPTATQRGDWVVQEDHSAQPALRAKERRVGRTLVAWVLVAMAVALVVVAVLMRDWMFFMLALLIFIPYAFLLMWPVWLARSTQVAQKTEHRRDAEKEGPLPKP